MEGGGGGGRKEGKAEKVMEGVASLALLPSGSISGHFVQLPHSICYGLHGIELECERECSRGEDYRLIKLTVTDFNSKRERDIVVECRGHDAAKICSTDHAHGWQKDVVGMLEEKHGKSKVSVSFECETLKADKAAEDHLEKFMPKLVGTDAVVNIGRMTIAGLDFDADTEHDRIDQNDRHIHYLNEQMLGMDFVLAPAYFIQFKVEGFTQLRTIYKKI